MGKGFIALLALIGLVPLVVSQNDALLNFYFMQQMARGGGGGLLGQPAPPSNQGSGQQGQGATKSATSGAQPQTPKGQMNPLLFLGMAGGNDNLLALSLCGRMPVLCMAGGLVKR